MKHLGEGTIHAWLDGALNDDETAEAERHVATCAACAALVAEARGLIAGASRILSALDDVGAGVVPEGGAGSTRETATKRARWMRPVAWLAAAGLLFAVGIETEMRTRSETTIQPGSARIDSVGAAAAKPAVVADVPTRRDTAMAANVPARRDTAKAKVAAAPAVVPPAAALAKSAGAVAPLRATGGASPAAERAENAGAPAVMFRAMLGERPLCFRRQNAEPRDAAADRQITEAMVAPAIPQLVMFDTTRAEGTRAGVWPLRDSTRVVGSWMKVAGDSVALEIGGRVVKGMVVGRELRLGGEVFVAVSCLKE